MSSQLPNYLRTARKRLALSQEDVAVLLGAECGAKVCRYERFTREPSLRTALACAVIFQQPVNDLFAGLYRAMEKKVAVRAKALVRKAEGLKPTRQTAQKQATLATLTASLTKQMNHPR